MGSDKPQAAAPAEGTGRARIADALTLYLWRVPALQLANWTKATGLPGATLAAAHVFLSLLVFAAFWRGFYWLGLLLSCGVMIQSAAAPMLDRLERRLVNASDIVTGLLWWWGWAHGLAAWGRPLPPVYTTMVLWVVVGGAVAILGIETLSRHRFGFEIHEWRAFDSRFKLVSAARNTNLIILAAALLFRRPDSGLVLAAWWTLISLIIHAVRLAQVTERRARGAKIVSWLDE